MQHDANFLPCTQLGKIVVKLGEITKSGAKCGNVYFRSCNFAVWNGDAQIGGGILTSLLFLLNILSYESCFSHFSLSLWNHN